MVRNVDDLDYCLSSHPQSILEGLRSLCSHPKLVDVTLSAGGRDFPCHRGVLALCSTYFHSMFSGDFVESIAARVELHDVDPDILSCLLDFAYTGKLTINQSNVEGLICTSSQLQFQTVRAVCSRYLQHQIDATNCLGILEFGAVHGCPEVMAKAWAFLLENFEAVQQGEEFLLMAKGRLVTCLSDEGLQIRAECTRVDAILRWVRHQEESRLSHLPELFALCHLSLLTVDYLSDTLLKDSMVLASPNCREAVERIHREVSEFAHPILFSLVSFCLLQNNDSCFPFQKLEMAPELSDRLSSQSPQPNLQEVLFVMGGRSLDDSDDDDSDDEERDPRLQRLLHKNCGFYNTKTSKTFFFLFSCVLLPSLFRILLGKVHLNFKWKKELADVLWVIKSSVDSFVGMWSGGKKSQDIKRDIVTSDWKICEFYFVKVVKTQGHNMQAKYQNSDTHCSSFHSMAVKLSC